MAYEYIHGGDVYTNPQVVEFSANINFLGMPQAVAQAVSDSLSQAEHYPDALCRDLRRDLAKFHHVSEDWLYCGNGASEVFFRLVQALQPRRALILAPTFADYEKALKSVKCKVRYYDLRSEADFVIQGDIVEQIKNVDMVVICNPNNPTGLLCEPGLMKAILKRCTQQGACLVVDECFLDFVKKSERQSMVGELMSHHNLVVLKAFTKIFAMPGLRLGYCLLNNQGLAEALYEVGPDWNVSTLAQVAGRAALKETEYLDNTWVVTERERNFLLTGLSKLGIKTFASKANYIFFHCEETDLQGKLLTKNILVRDCRNYRNLQPGYYRIAVRGHEDNILFLQVLKELLAK